MINYRKSIFETNSSSSHSITIGPEESRIVNNDIPRNLGILFQVPEYKRADGREDSTVRNTLITEVAKLSFLFNIVATYISNLADGMSCSSDKFISTKFSELCERNVLQSDQDIKLAMSRDLIYMRWIKDVVFEETGTKIEIPIPEETYFPYFDILYTDSGDDFYNEIMNTMKNNNEAKFKSICREIVFNPDILIEDLDRAYCCDIIENVL